MSDFNIHLERVSASDDIYVYRRGSSEGQYKYDRKLSGRVIDMDVDIPDAIVPKYYRIKCTTQPTLCEITGNVENVTGVEVPSGGGSNVMYDDVIFLHDYSDMQNTIINVTELLNGIDQPCVKHYTVDNNTIDITLERTSSNEIHQIGLYPIQDVSIRAQMSYSNVEFEPSYSRPIVYCEYSGSYPSEVVATNNVTGKKFIVHF